MQKKIEEYPQRQFVLEKNGIVVGALYSQRIENKTIISKIDFVYDT